VARAYFRSQPGNEAEVVTKSEQDYREIADYCIASMMAIPACARVYRDASTALILQAREKKGQTSRSMSGMAIFRQLNRLFRLGCRLLKQERAGPASFDP
jgi:hypothetical protein